MASSMKKVDKTKGKGVNKRSRDHEILKFVGLPTDVEDSPHASDQPSLSNVGTGQDISTPHECGVNETCAEPRP